MLVDLQNASRQRLMECHYHCSKELDSLPLQFKSLHYKFLAFFFLFVFAGSQVLKFIILLINTVVHAYIILHDVSVVEYCPWKWFL